VRRGVLLEELAVGVGGHGMPPGVRVMGPRQSSEPAGGESRGEGGNMGGSGVYANADALVEAWPPPATQNCVANAAIKKPVLRPRKRFRDHRRIVFL
jgi:hypothetical protein